jgi:hypothetical protein
LMTANCWSLLGSQRLVFSGREPFRRYLSLANVNSFQGTTALLLFVYKPVDNKHSTYRRHEKKNLRYNPVTYFLMISFLADNVWVVKRGICGIPSFNSRTSSTFFLLGRSSSSSSSSSSSESSSGAEGG